MRFSRSCRISVAVLLVLFQTLSGKNSAAQSSSTPGIVTYGCPAMMVLQGAIHAIFFPAMISYYELSNANVGQKVPEAFVNSEIAMPVTLLTVDAVCLVAAAINEDKVVTTYGIVTGVMAALAIIPFAHGGFRLSQGGIIKQNGGGSTYGLSLSKGAFSPTVSPQFYEGGGALLNATWKFR